MDLSGEDVTKITRARGRYTLVMAKPTEGVGKTTVRYRLAGAEIAALLAVEGMKLTPESAKRLMRTKSLSPAKRRAATIAAYKAARGR